MEDLNLDKMYKDTIEKAYRKYSKYTDEQISKELGTSVRNLYRYLDTYKIDRIKIRKESRSEQELLQAIGKLTLMG